MTNCPDSSITSVNFCGLTSLSSFLLLIFSSFQNRKSITYNCPMSTSLNNCLSKMEADIASHP